MDQDPIDHEAPRDDEQGAGGAGRPDGARPVEDDAADLSLALVSEATAMTQDDGDFLEQSDENLREVVREKVDHPLDPQQEEVVSVLGAAGGSVAAGLSVALAEARGVEPRDVLQSVAQAVLAQRSDAATADPWSRPGQDLGDEGRRRQDAGHEDDADA